MPKKPVLSIKVGESSRRASEKWCTIPIHQVHQPMRSELYRRAEARLRDESRTPSRKARDQKSDRDLLRALHQSVVQQAELEMENAELRKARTELELMLEKFTDLYDFAPVGYMSVDESGAVLEGNLTSDALLNLERSRLIGRSLSALMSPPSRLLFGTFLRKVFEGQSNQACEVQFRKPDGVTFWASLRALPAIHPKGERKWCRVVIADISDRKQVEEDLRETEKRYRSLFEAVPVGVYACDAKGVIQQFNNRAAELWGRAPVLGESDAQFCGLLKLFHPDGRLMPYNQSPMAAVISGRVPMAQNAEVLIERPDGSRIATVMNIHQLRNERGEVARTLNCFYDITERKRTETALSRLAAIVKSSADAIISKDLSGVVTSWNEGAERIFGYTASQMVGTSIMRLIPVARRKEEKMILAKIKRGEMLEHFETRRRTRSGRLIDVSVTISPIRDATGQIIGASKVARDITERKKAAVAERRLAVLTASNWKLQKEIIRRRKVEESLHHTQKQQSQLLDQSRQMQEQLRQLSHRVLSAQEDERKRISRELHDVIAQTLASINLRLSILAKDGALSPKELEQSIARTQKLVAQSVDTVHRFARELRPTALDDLGLIPALQTFLKNFTAQTGIHVRLTATAGLAQVNGDKRTVLFRVTQEALANVARHAKASRAEVKIQKTDESICLEISDNGKGFPAERVLQTKKKERLGLLGMSERVQMVNGNFTIQSTPGKCTSVRVQIPLNDNQNTRANGGHTERRQNDGG